MQIAFNRLTRGAIIFIILVLVFDGVRTIGKIPGPGGIVYRKYALMDKTSNKEIVKISSYLGHKSVTYVVGDEQNIRTNAKGTNAERAVGSATSDVTVHMGGFNKDARDKFKRAFNDNTDPATDSHNTHLSEDCLNYIRNVYAIEWSMFSLIMASLLMLLVSYFYITGGPENAKAGTFKRRGNATIYKIMFYLFMFYVILKIARISMEAHVFRKDYDDADETCLNRAFKEQGVNLLDNYLNLIHGDHSITGGNVLKTNLRIDGVHVGYDALTHYAVMDGLHVVILLFFAYMGIFTDMAMISNPTPYGEKSKNSLWSPIELQGDMSSTEAGMMNLLSPDEVIDSK